ncbi:MspA family porin, partial [Mycobacterium sp. GA-2829]|uniref:MspA family porin n=1 Tax=Mycobacterium sp. GA-2829 TaxID=1772283 RepID=UPI0007402D8C
MKAISRVLVALIAAAAALFTSTGTSNAGLDNELSLLDGQGRTLTVQQWDTFLNGVFPLDRNRLTREWFHSGRAKYIVAGEGAEDFEGSLELGYQIGFPWSLGVGINFSYTTPNIAFDSADFGVIDPIGDGTAIDILPEIVTPPLFPGVSISADLGNGPGIQEVATFAVDVTG